MRRLIQNLVSNAIKYTRSGRILVGVRRRGELAEIQVFDTGIGIPVDKLNSVFREFTRLDEGAREAQGLGLGLSIVDRIARVLRLELQIDSGRGKGTRFSVILPVTAGAGADAARQSRRAARGPTAALDRHGGAVHRQRRAHPRRHAPAARGLGLPRRSPPPGRSSRGPRRTLRPDIVLADYHLDGETGLDVIARAARRARATTLPAVLITADRSNEVRAARRTASTCRCSTSR